MPTNRQPNSSLTRVEAKKPSKEFHAEADNLTIEVLHAARLLTEHFEKLGYDEWILLGVCSRKLLEKVQQRVPNPQYVEHPTLLRPAVEPSLGVWTGGTTPMHPPTGLPPDGITGEEFARWQEHFRSLDAGRTQGSIDTDAYLESLRQQRVRAEAALHDNFRTLNTPITFVDLPMMVDQEIVEANEHHYIFPDGTRVSGPTESSVQRMRRTVEEGNMRLRSGILEAQQAAQIVREQQPMGPWTGGTMAIHPITGPPITFVDMPPIYSDELRRGMEEQERQDRLTTEEVIANFGPSVLQPLPQMVAQAHEQAQEQRAAIERREFAEQVMNQQMAQEALENETPL